MLDDVDITKVLVIDIETVSQHRTFAELTDEWKEFWTKKALSISKDKGEPAQLYEERAAIYSEFGKIVCISAGFFAEQDGKLKFHVKSYCGSNEKEILSEFGEMLDTSFSGERNNIIGHNAKEFDFPYIARRCLINGVKIPAILDNSGKKPWEVKLLDTMELWKFGDYKSFVSLKMLAALFGIESPKGDIDGSMVGRVYWEEEDVERIKEYCQKDVITVAQILLTFKRMHLLDKESEVIFK